MPDDPLDAVPDDPLDAVPDDPLDAVPDDLLDDPLDDRFRLMVHRVGCGDRPGIGRHGKFRRARIVTRLTVANRPRGVSSGRRARGTGGPSGRPRPEKRSPRGGRPAAEPEFFAKKFPARSKPHWIASQWGGDQRRRPDFPDVTAMASQPSSAAKT
ncbi:hypothetical protein GCM10009735_59450 [Actinomadura chokoriensis]